MEKRSLKETGTGAVPLVESLIMIEIARKEYMKLVGKMELKQAKKYFVPRTPPTTFNCGDKDLVYGVPTAKCKPRTFISRDDNVILVQEPNDKVQP